MYIKENKRIPKIKWEKLREAEIVQQYRNKIEELTEDLAENEGEDEETKYGELIKIVTTAAREVCGTDERRVENPWLIGKDDLIQRLKSRIAGAVTRRNEIS